MVWVGILFTAVPRFSREGGQGYWRSIIITSKIQKADFGGFFFEKRDKKLKVDQHKVLSDIMGS